MALKQGRGWDAEIQGNISCVLYYNATLGRPFIVTGMAGPLFLRAVFILAGVNLRTLSTKSQLYTVTGGKECLLSLQPIQKQIAIYLYCDSCKICVSRRAITMLVQKGLSTRGTGQLLLFVPLMLHDFGKELFGALYWVRTRNTQYHLWLIQS